MMLCIEKGEYASEDFMDEIKDLQKRLEEIWTDMREVLVRLSSIQ